MKEAERERERTITPPTTSPPLASPRYIFPSAATPPHPRELAFARRLCASQISAPRPSCEQQGVCRVVSHPADLLAGRIQFTDGGGGGGVD
uniref:Uncharacterized protein n=1 Tax=Oryza meridionalis TaxID=40149 RepID=A0A0E0EHG1_9ORYZ